MARSKSDIYWQTCPACGGNRPARSLILCRACWSKLPRYVQTEAYNAARADRRSIECGETAAKVIATACKAS